MNALTVNGKQLTIDGVEILGYDNSVPYTLLYENDNTYTGAAELAQIPSSCGGTGA